MFIVKGFCYQNFSAGQPQQKVTLLIMRSKSWSFILLLIFMTLMVVTARDDSLVRQNTIELCKNSGREAYENPNPNPNSENVEMCCKCLPGSYKAYDCTPHVPETTVCKDCPFNNTDSTNQYYMDVHNNSTRCHRSLQPFECKTRMRTKYVMGSRYNNSRCDCIPGSYKHGDGCLKHSTCDPGFQPSSLGTTTSNTKCEPCSPGRFSSISSTTAPCIPHSLCPADKVKLKDGTSTSDTLCSGSNLPSKLSITAAPIVTVRNQTSSNTTQAPSTEANPVSTTVIIIIVVVIFIIIIIAVCVWWHKCRWNRKDEGVWCKFCGNRKDKDESPPDTPKPDESSQGPSNPERNQPSSIPNERSTRNSPANGNLSNYENASEESSELERRRLLDEEEDPQASSGAQINNGDPKQRNGATTWDSPHNNTKEVAPLIVDMPSHDTQLSTEREGVRFTKSESQPENDTRIGRSNMDESGIKPIEAQPKSSQKCDYDMVEMQNIDHTDGSREINSKAEPIYPSSQREPSIKSTHSANLTEPEDSEATGDNQARSSEQSSENCSGTETIPKETGTDPSDQRVSDEEPETSDLETPLQYAEERARNNGATDNDIEDALANHETGKKMMDTLIDDFVIAEVKKYVRAFLTDVEINDIENEEQLSYERRYKWIQKIKMKKGGGLTPKFILDKGFELNAMRDCMVEVFVNSLN